MEHKHIKDFENFLNENLYGLKIASTLMDIADKGWATLGFQSADDIYEDLAKQKKYIDMLNSEIEKAGIEKHISSNADTIHDELESENYHHLNAFLAISGYYNPKYKERYLGYIKNSKSSQWALHLI
jgi:hypothetical protein